MSESYETPHIIVYLATTGPHLHEWFSIPDKKGKVGPYGYAITGTSVGQQVLYGAAFESSSYLPFAYAVGDLLERLMADEVVPFRTTADAFKLEVRIKGAGPAAYLSDFVLRWMSQGGLNSDFEEPQSYEAWKRFMGLCSHGSVVFVPWGGRGKLKELNELHTWASKAKSMVGKGGSDTNLGVVFTDVS